jgi:hypothetical protein
MNRVSIVTTDAGAARFDRFSNGETEFSFGLLTSEGPQKLVEGQVWALGTGCVNDWSGQDGTLAAYANGGWLFLTPRTGWRATAGCRRCLARRGSVR